MKNKNRNLQSGFVRFEVSPSHKVFEVRAGCPGRDVPSAEEQELRREDAGSRLPDGSQETRAHLFPLTGT